MSKNADKRKCSAICNDGRPCQAWAMIDSEPARCSVHAGRNVGLGAKMGNTNAMKHGLYMSVMRPDEVEDLERLTSISLLHELVLVRTVLLRLANYLKNEDLALEDLLAIVPVMVGGVRTVAFLMKNIDTNLFDWDEVLDVLNDEWEIDV